MKKVESLVGYFKKIDYFCKKIGTVGTTTLPWYRGQLDAKWDLVPSLYRVNTNAKFEREMNRDFILRAKPYLSSTPVNSIEWLFIMQHYGLPTRLLDWTESHLIALFFAIKDYRLRRDAAVWILEPWSLNLTSLGRKTIPTFNYSGLNKYIVHDSAYSIKRQPVATTPIAVRAIRSTPRIIAQRGMFTLHGSDRSSLNSIADNSKTNSKDNAIRLHKIVIDGSKRRSLLKQLYMAGVSDSLLFPGLDGLSREIAYRYSNQFLNGLGFELQEHVKVPKMNLLDVDTVDWDSTDIEPLEEIEEDVNLDSFGSGSGLLDLSLQADDTSLGGIIDEIYTSEDKGTR